MKNHTILDTTVAPFVRLHLAENTECLVKGLQYLLI